jgi:integrase
MPRTVTERLTAQGVRTAGIGRHGDGGGLYLLVRKPKKEGGELGRFWVFRWVQDGRMREAGLGPAAGVSPVSLAEARKKARTLLDQVRDGLDPLAERDTAIAAKKRAAAKAVAEATTFRQCAGDYIAAHEATWRNPKHRQQWKNTLNDYAYPIIGDTPVSAVDSALVLKIIEPHWLTKNETMARLRQRIEAILDSAKVRGLRSGENPARWKGHLDKAGLAKRSKAAMVARAARGKKQEHWPSLPYKQMPDFMPKLRAEEGTAARALEVAILCGSRSNEIRKMRWSEYDPAEGAWTIPGPRMKGGREHRVPLTDRAVEIVEAQRGRDDEFVFPGRRARKPLSDGAMLMLVRRMRRDDGGQWVDEHGDVVVPHGFRATFRTWASDRTNFPSEVAEAALAHVNQDETEAAYQRGDFFEKRRKLMQAWARQCAAPTSDRKVVALRG